MRLMLFTTIALFACLSSARCQGPLLISNGREQAESFGSRELGRAQEIQNYQNEIATPFNPPPATRNVAPTSAGSNSPFGGNITAFPFAPRVARAREVDLAAQGAPPVHGVLSAASMKVAPNRPAASANSQKMTELLHRFKFGSAQAANSSRESGANFDFHAGIVNADEIDLPPTYNVDLPEAVDHEVAVVDHDGNICRVATQSQIRNSPDFIDSQIVRAAAQAHWESSRVDEIFLYYRDGTVFRVPWNAINTLPAAPARTFVQTDNMIVPVSRDGSQIFDEENTPTIAALKREFEEQLARRAQLRVEIGWIVWQSTVALTQFVGTIDPAGFTSQASRSLTLPALRPGGQTFEALETVRLGQAEYRAALEHVFPHHSLNEVASAIDSIGRRAAERVVADPHFLLAVERGDWKRAGTLFHNAAAIESRSAAQLPEGWSLFAERTIQSGKGGSRADLLMRGPAEEIIEIDWKTTGASALGSRAVTQMERHAEQLTRGEVRSNLGGDLIGQQSRSWLDYVRPLLPAAIHR